MKVCKKCKKHVTNKSKICKFCGADVSKAKIVPNDKKVVSKKVSNITKKPNKKEKLDITSEVKLKEVNKKLNIKTELIDNLSSKKKLVKEQAKKLKKQGHKKVKQVPSLINRTKDKSIKAVKKVRGITLKLLGQVKSKLSSLFIKFKKIDIKSKVCNLKTRVISFFSNQKEKLSSLKNKIVKILEDKKNARLNNVKQKPIKVKEKPIKIKKKPIKIKEKPIKFKEKNVRVKEKINVKQSRLIGFKQMLSQKIKGLGNAFRTKFDSLKQVIGKSKPVTNRLSLKILVIGFISLVALGTFSYFGVDAYKDLTSEEKTLAIGEKATTDKIFSMGDLITYKGVDYKVVKVETSEGNSYKAPKEGNEFLIVTIYMKNNTGEKVPYSYVNYTMSNSNGEEKTRIFTSINVKDALYSGNLVIGGIKTGSMVFEQPKDDPKLRINFYELKKGDNGEDVIDYSKKVFSVSIKVPTKEEQEMEKEQKNLKETETKEVSQKNLSNKKN